jgi:hypothetical protein
MATLAAEAKVEYLLQILAGLIGIGGSTSSSNPGVLTILSEVIKFAYPAIDPVLLSLVVRKAGLALDVATDPNALWLEIDNAIVQGLDGQKPSVIQ